MQQFLYVFFTVTEQSGKFFWNFPEKADMIISLTYVEDKASK